MEKEKKDLYYKYSSYLKKRYEQKVYKIPINIQNFCPNGDGTLGGCTYCSRVSLSRQMLSEDLSVKEQIDENIAYIRPRYGAKKFIAYFQNGTNTFLPLDTFEKYLYEVDNEDIVAVSISTRPDCIEYSYLDIMDRYKKETGRDIIIELGLQSTNHNTLKKINRGHSLAEFIDAVMMIKKYDFLISAHVILNLPWDSKEDIIEMAKILSAFKIDIVKAHSLHIAKYTKLAKQFLNKEFEVCPLEEYIERAGLFVAYLSKDMAIERLTSRIQQEDSLFCNYRRSWWVIIDMIDEYLEKNNLFQGIYCDYLGGKQFREVSKN